MQAVADRQNMFKKSIMLGLWLTAIVYCLVLLKIVVLKNGINFDMRSVNFLPFQFMIDLAVKHVSIDVVLKNVLGNFAIFIPYGILTASLRKYVTLKRTIWIGFATSLFIEIMQYVLRLGITDIDDIILNTLGTAVGAVLYFKLLKNFDKKLKCKLCTLGFLCTFGIAGVWSIWLYEPSILPSQTEYVNKEILGNINADRGDKSGICSSISENAVSLYERVVNGTGKSDERVNTRLLLEDEAEFFTCTADYKYSPNGNIQKSTYTYAKMTREEFQSLISEKDRNIEVWTQDGKCSVILAWVWN